MSWRPPRARRYAEPNRPLAPPPTKMASYSRSSSSGVATFHRPSVFSRGWATMSSISRAHSPTVSGAPGAPRSRRSAGRVRGSGHAATANPSDGFRTSIIATPRHQVGCCSASLAVGRAGQVTEDEEPPGHRPARSGRPAWYSFGRDHGVACRVPGRHGRRGAAGGPGPLLRRDRVQPRPAYRPDQRSDLHEPLAATAPLAGMAIRAAWPGVLGSLAGGRATGRLTERALRAGRVPPPGSREAAHARHLQTADTLG